MIKRLFSHQHYLVDISNAKRYIRANIKQLCDNLLTAYRPFSSVTSTSFVLLLST